MEKSQYDLCIQVLRHLERANVLSKVVLVGSWCLLFYKEYFQGVQYFPTIRTRDIDFLVPEPSHLRVKADIPEILKTLGFVKDYTVPASEFATTPIIRLVHPDLIIEFLVPDKGSGKSEPYPLPQLDVTAQRLHFLHLLALKTTQVKVEGIAVTLPHPAYFGVHKWIVAGRRPIHLREKKEKDIQQGIDVINAVLAKNELPIIKEALQEISAKARSTIKSVLVEKNELKLILLLGL